MMAVDFNTCRCGQITQIENDPPVLLDFRQIHPQRTARCGKSARTPVRIPWINSTFSWTFPVNRSGDKRRIGFGNSLEVREQNGDSAAYPGRDDVTIFTPEEMTRLVHNARAPLPGTDRQPRSFGDARRRLFLDLRDECGDGFEQDRQIG